MNVLAMAQESSTDPQSTLPAAETMRRNGRSFWFASRLLPCEVAADAAQLYAFCRTLDDLADKDPHTADRTAFAGPCGRSCAWRNDDVCAVGLMALARRKPVPLEPAAHLVAAFVEGGSQPLQLQT